MKRYLASIVGLLLAPVLFAQERAANGQIYGELKPFVGLQGVRFQVTGLGGGIWNVPTSKGETKTTVDPETDATGLSHDENLKLAEEIRADAVETFKVNGIPLLTPQQEDMETRPVLVVSIDRYRPRDPNEFATRVEI
jgi:hypothetical protein